MKTEQDRMLLPADEVYIRRIIEYTNLEDDSDERTDIQTDKGPFRVAVCMFPEASRQLLQAQYLQSDIAFKRVVGFEEFELGSMDLASRTSEYCYILGRCAPH